MQNPTSLPLILQKTADFLKVHWQKVLFVVLIVYTPFNAVMSFFPAEGPAAGDDFQLWRNAGAVSLSQTLKGFAGILVSLALAVLVEAHTRNENVSLKEVLLRSLKRLPVAFGTILVTSILVGLLFLALIVPGVMFTIFWMFALTAVALRGVSFFGALSYSKALVKGRWWKTFGYALVLMLIGGVIAVAAGSLGGIFASVISGLIPFQPVFRLFNILVFTFVDLTQTFITAGLVFFFLQWEETRGPGALPAIGGVNVPPAAI